ncbi:peptidyl-prolyl cis-trans isomerase FKBP10 [Tachysurus fulvidraco]|uniref:peptidyl-prolyl cis-trans isomerase FKBP10 n=1 Tax=Tachysurus fulvidraco TaxID=1234273 RepID=UPI000F4FB283|nr:peptidyl-prolyl cis-trans isomerase FKBP10 [Tachysurus fulvidraco]
MAVNVALSVLCTYFACAVCNAGPSEDLLIDRYSLPIRCGREVQVGDYVRYHYNGSFPDGRIFDSSEHKGMPLVVPVGLDSKVIPGLDRGVVGMCVNERRKITIPPHLGYGISGAGTMIPSDATLVFDVFLLDVWNKDDGVDTRLLFKPLSCRRSVQHGDFVRYLYNGSLINGTNFKSSHGQNVTYDTYVDEDHLISGMVQGLMGMCVGEKRSIIIPPFLAYGEKGYGGKVPAHATVVFDVLLIDVFNVKDDVQMEVLHVPQPCRRKSQKGDFIRYHYNGTFQDGTLFDSSYQRKSTYNTFVGLGHVIAGVDKALQGVCVGEKRHIIVPPHLAYGENGTGDLIPGSAVLIFDLHIVDFHNPKDSVDIQITHKPLQCINTSAANDLVTYHYNCSLLDRTRLYSSIDLGRPAQATLAQGDVIEGLDQGLTGMCVGEKREVIVPPHYGHGQNEGSLVPADAVLIFELELMDLQKGVPKGFLFIWLEETPDPLFNFMDLNQDGEVPLEEFAAFIRLQVSINKGRLHPAMDEDVIIRQMFTSQDRNYDGRITEDELRLQTDNTTGHDEL